MTKRETISTGPVATFQDRLIDWHCEQVMDGKVDEVIVSRTGFKYLYKNNMINYIGDTNEPLFFGHRVRVPGSALA